MVFGNRKLRYSKRLTLAIALGLLFTIAVTYAATVYILYDWTLTMTSAIPDVQFCLWSDMSLYNTIDLGYNIYQDAWTYDTNATYGIRNTGTVNHTTFIYINAINVSSYVANVTVEVRSQDGTALEATSTWATGSALPTIEQSWLATNSTNYMIRVWVKGSSTTGAVQIEMRLKV